MKKRGHFRCERCKRLIATGKEVWYKGSPYGTDCYRVVINLDVSFYENLSRSTSESSETQKDVSAGPEFL